MRINTYNVKWKCINASGSNYQMEFYIIANDEADALKEFWAMIEAVRDTNNSIDVVGIEDE